MTKIIFKKFLFLLTLPILLFGCKETTVENNEIIPISPFTSLNITANSITDITLEVQYDEDSKLYPYFTGVIPQEMYESYASQPKLLVDYAKSVVDGTLTTVDDKYIYNGNATISLSSIWDLEENRSYYAIAFAVNENDELLTNIETKPFMVEKVEEKGRINPFTIKIGGTSSNDISAEIIYDTKTESYPYFVGVVQRDTYDAYTDAESEMLAFAKATVDGPINVKDDKYVFARSNNIDIASIWDLKTEGDYYLVVFAVDDNDQFITNIEKKVFKTSENPDAIVSVSVAENVYGSMLIDVDVAETFDGTYALTWASQSMIEEYGSAEAYALGVMNALIETYAMDYSKPDGLWVLKGDVQNFELYDLFFINPGEMGEVVAVGCDKTGKISTNVETTGQFMAAGIYTAEDINFPDAEFGEISIDGYNGTTFNININPDDQSMYYLLDIESESSFNASTMETFYSDLMNAYAYECYTNDVPLEKGLAQILKKGTATYAVSGIRPESDYVAYVVGVDINTGYPITKYEVARYSTAAFEVPDGEIGEVTISDITMHEATATVTGTTYEGVYSLLALSANYLRDEFNNDLVAAIENTTVTAAGEALSYGKTIEDFIDYKTFFKGDCTVEMADLRISKLHGKLGPQSDYVILTAGISPHGKVVTEVNKVEFSTKPLPEDFKIDIEAYDATQFSATIKTTPTYDDIDYAMYAFPKEKYESMTIDEVGAEIEEAYGAWFFFMLKDNAENIRFVDEFEANTNYVAFAYAYAIGTGVIGDVYTTEFKTLPVESSAPENSKSFIYDKLGIAAWRNNSYYKSHIPNSQEVEVPYRVLDPKTAKISTPLLQKDEVIRKFRADNPKPQKSILSSFKMN